MQYDNQQKLTGLGFGSCDMQYAIEMYYDKETEEQLFSLAKSVVDAGLSTKFMEWKTRPHLTLACFNDVDEFPVDEIYTVEFGK